MDPLIRVRPTTQYDKSPRNVGLLRQSADVTNQHAQGVPGNRFRVDPRLHGKDPAAAPGLDGSYPVLCHLLDTAVVIETLWDTRVRPKLRARIAEAIGVSESDTRRLLAFTAAVHDVGKINPFFQYQERYGAAGGFAPALAEAVGLPGTPPLLRAAMSGDPKHPLRRHEFISHRIVTGAWADEMDAFHRSPWVGTVAGGHHGYWRDPNEQTGWVGGPGGRGDQLNQGWTKQQDALLCMVEETFDLKAREVPPLPKADAGVPFICFSGLLTTADWIASEDLRVAEGKTLWGTLAQSTADPYASPEAAREWMERRRPEFAAHVLQALGPTANVTRADIAQATIGSFHPRALQQEVLDLTEESDPGLWIAMYPTGDGKTEAAILRGAVNTDEGLVFALPTLATTDAMERRLAELARSLPAGVAFPLVKSHQFAQVMTSGDEPEGTDLTDDDCCDHISPTWYTASIRKLVAPNVVATVDQVLVGALAQRHITMRLMGLANHHIVLDEVHTYDPYQTELLIELLYWWGSTRTRVTLLSATLPTTHMRSMLRAYRAGVLGLAYEDPAAQIDALEGTFPSTVSVSTTPVGGDVEIHVALPLGAVRRPQDTRIELESVASRAERIAAHAGWARLTARAHPTSPIAIVSNVVADCTAIAEALADDPEVSATHDVLCLHSGLVAGHRRATEQALLQRAGKQAHERGFGSEHRPIIVVGTQVIQASLDFDVDFMATDLAPAPDLIQRLGRAWRFEAAGDLLRGGRLAAGSTRALRVVSVVDDQGVPSRAGSVPYLNAVLRRTHAALLERVVQTPTVDILDFSQDWVDAAYDRDPMSLIAEDEREQSAALDEALDATSKTNAATASRAQLARRGDLSGIAFLPAPRGRHAKSATWKDLVVMTSRADDENLMRTRYIEGDSLNVLLFDSRGTSYYVDPRDGTEVPFPVLDAAALIDMSTPEILRWSTCLQTLVPQAFWSYARPAIDATLAGLEWKPRSKTLASIFPLDLRHLGGVLTYHPRSGLLKEEQ